MHKPKNSSSTHSSLSVPSYFKLNETLRKAIMLYEKEQSEIIIYKNKKKYTCTYCKKQYKKHVSIFSDVLRGPCASEYRNVINNFDLFLPWEKSIVQIFFSEYFWIIGAFLEKGELVDKIRMCSFAFYINCNFVTDKSSMYRNRPKLEMNTLDNQYTNKILSYKFKIEKREKTYVLPLFKCLPAKLTPYNVITIIINNGIVHLNSQLLTKHRTFITGVIEYLPDFSALMTFDTCMNTKCIKNRKDDLLKNIGEVIQQHLDVLKENNIIENSIYKKRYPFYDPYSSSSDDDLF
jgi:hypothetical protein